MNRLVPLTLALALGCSPVWTRGKRLADAGRFEEATRYWLDALDADLDAPAPRRGLERHGPDAVAVRLDLAREHEAERRFEAALEEYAAALALADELAAVGVDPHLDRDALALEIADVEAAWADHRFAQGERAAAEGDWMGAIDRWTRVLDIRPDDPRVPGALARAYRAAGLAAKDRHEPALAIELLEQADAWGDDGTARAWADAVRTALGRWALGEGGCRTAADLLAPVARRTGDPRLHEDVAHARDCARVELVVHPFAHPDAVPSLAGTDLAGRLTDAVSERLRADGSPFLVLVDPDLAAGVARTRGRRYDVRGRLSQVLLEHDAPVPEPRRVPGTTRIPCPPVDGYPTYEPTWCDAEVEVSTTVWTASASLILGGAVRVTDPTSGEVALARSFEARADGEAIHREPFVDADGQPIAVGGSPGDGTVAIDPALAALPTTPPPLPSDADLIAEATAAFADAAAAEILARVDTEPPLPEPPALPIEPPITAPGQIEFAPSEAGGGPPTRAVIPVGGVTPPGRPGPPPRSP